MEPELIAGLLILVVVYVLIAFNLIHRTVAALLGALLVGVAAYVFGFAGVDDIIHFVDFETIGLLMSMMIIVGILGRTGFFQVVAYKTARVAGGSPMRVLLTLTLLTALLSAFLDNVTTILLVLPVTLELARAFKLDPRPYILSEIFASNIGGTATLVGDPPNIMIGTHADLGFTAFIANLGPIVLIDLALLMGVMVLLYGRALKGSTLPSEADIERMERKYTITDRALYYKCIFILFFTISLFIVGEFFGIPPVAAAFAGATLLLIISREDIWAALEHVEWPTLLFFAGLFVVVGGIERMGVLGMIAEGIISVSEGNVIIAIVTIVWVSAFVSSIIDNIPFTATMIPVVFAISERLQMSPEPLFWALALGACMGGNATLIGASANVVGVDLAERHGILIDFKTFLKNGVVVTLITVGVATVYLIVRYVWFAG